MEALKSLSGNFGTFFVSNTSEKAIRFIGFKVEADAVVSSLIQGGSNVRTNYWTTAGETLPAGLVVKAQGDNPFTSITLTSGKVTLILEG